ncbi:MAG TPA: hypothetical protein VGJ37_02165 [Pyrinomonadaceae bacterium]|jgi:CubicO group peptidase (beta-lactamase class C family)
MKQVADVSGRNCCLAVLSLCLLLTQVIAKPSGSSTTGKPATPAIDFSELDKLVPAELKEKNTPGAVIAVISGDQVIYQKAFGVANVETNAEMRRLPKFVARARTTRRIHSSLRPLVV